MSGKLLSKNSKLGLATRVLSLTLMVLFILFIPTGVTGDKGSNQINLADQLPKLQTDGKALFESYYRGVDQQFMPDLTNPNDSKFKYWNDTESIQNGLSLLKTVSDLNPNYPSLYKEFTNAPTNVKSVLLRSVLKNRSDPKDIWWTDFDHTVNAYTVLEQLHLVNKTISQINAMDNNSFDLYDYYSNVLNGTITINGTIVHYISKIKVANFCC